MSSSYSHLLSTAEWRPLQYLFNGINTYIIELMRRVYVCIYISFSKTASWESNDNARFNIVLEFLFFLIIFRSHYKFSYLLYNLCLILDVMKNT